jgi:hypothetical protein
MGRPLINLKQIHFHTTNTKKRRGPMEITHLYSKSEISHAVLTKTIGIWHTPHQ